MKEWMVCRKLSGDVRLGEGTGKKDIGVARTLMYGGLGQVLPYTRFGACCTSIRNASPLAFSGGLLVDGKHRNNDMRQ
jgi:hypothetical protein